MPIFKADIQGRLKKVTFLFKADIKIFVLCFKTRDNQEKDKDKGYDKDQIWQVYQEE